MEYLGKLPVIAPMCIVGFLSACANTSDTVITRAWQVDHVLNNINRECRYEVISDTAAEEVNLRIDADKVFEELFQACPELAMAAAAAGSGYPKDVSRDGLEVASAAPSFSADKESFGASTTDSAGTDSETNSGNSEAAEGSGGGETSDDSTGGDSTSSENGPDGSTSDDSFSDDNTKGSNANNGGGNGSEGSSPGRGKGANQDE